MRKFTILINKLYLVAFLFLASVLSASAADFMENGLFYNIITDNEVEVAQYVGEKYSGEIIIPASVVHDGVNYQVTRIGKQAFYYCSEVTVVDIPEGVTAISDMAFGGCSSLESMDFPNSLVSIDSKAFFGCEEFTGFYIPRNVAEIALDAFQNCPNVTSYMCNSMNAHFKSVNGILYSKDMTMLVAFPPSSPATSFDIPETVTKLQGHAFFQNKNLTRINIHERVTWLGRAVFGRCEKLDSLYIPDNVTYMGPSVCFCCEELKYVHISANIDSIHDDAFGYCTALKELTVPRKVKYIGEFAFSDSKIQTLHFEEGTCLNYIDNRCFEECNSLEHFDMPNTVTGTGFQLFGYCNHLKSIHLSTSLTTLEESTFVNCPELTELEIPNSVTTVRDYAFFSIPALKRLKIGDKNATPGTTTIERSAMRECNSLVYLELGANIDTIGYSAFQDADSLKTITCWASIPPKCNKSRHTFTPSPQELTAVLYVPKASLEAYRTATEWKNFTTIVAIEDLGDVNGDGNISISDVTMLIGLMLDGESTAHDLPLADMNLDGNISISDVTMLISSLALAE